MADDAIPGVDYDAAIAEALGDAETLDFEGGDTAYAAPGQEEEPSAAPEARGDQEPEASPEDRETPAGDEDFFTLPAEEAAAPDHPFGDGFRWEELPDDPAVQKLAKGLQGSYTRTQMQLAESKKQLEAERAELARYAQYEQLKLKDPQAAARLLQQELQALAPQSPPLSEPGAWSLEPGAAAQPPHDPFASIVPETETEAALLAGLRQSHQQLAYIQQQQQQLVSAQEQQALARQQQDLEQQMAREIDTIGKRMGREPTRDELNRIAAYANENGVARLDLAFQLMYQDHALKRAHERGKEAAAKELSRKSLQSAMPSGSPPRERAEREPTDADSIVAAALKQFGIG